MRQPRAFWMYINQVNSWKRESTEHEDGYTEVHRVGVTFDSPFMKRIEYALDVFLGNADALYWPND